MERVVPLIAQNTIWDTFQIFAAPNIGLEKSGDAITLLFVVRIDARSIRILGTISDTAQVLGIPNQILRTIAEGSIRSWFAFRESRVPNKQRSAIALQ